jgi:hypothetical protein
VWRLWRTADLPADASPLSENGTTGRKSSTRRAATRPNAPGRHRSGEETSGKTR